MKTAKIQLNGKSLSYNIFGKGKKVIVFLHGYLESKELWTDFSTILSSKYIVICPDLPGQGESDPQPEQTVESMAEAVSALLDFLKIENVFLFGHSMGGYVALAFAELFPEKLKAIGLLHSHPFSDSEEKQKQRSLEIDLVKKGKRELIIRNSIPKLFALEFIETNKFSVEKAIEMALKTTDEGMIACIYAMMKRKDRLAVLRKMRIPILMIAGRKDELILCSKAIDTSKEIDNITFYILENSGHVGMIEEPKKMLKKIEKFLF